jgi:D-alanyl-D-alanine carboxypeptidase/D-alanyl-D-alanine-endopeptidase (penicillin-binding protein 4)
MSLSLARRAPRLVLLAVLTACASTAAGTTATAPAPVSLDARAALRRSIDSLVEVPEFRNAHWGILIVDPVRAETLYARNADKLFLPASNQKLLTGSTALTQLGPDFRWPTAIFARGPVRGGVLEGDLVVRGSGDPSVSAHAHAGDALAPLRAIGDSLRARGITRIRGRLVAAPSPFTDAPLGYGWSWSELDEPYSAGVDALFFNEGYTQIVVRGATAAGDVATATSRPLASYPVLDVRARTVAPARAGASATDSMAALPAIKLERDTVRGTIVVTGTVAAGDSSVQEIAFRDQPAAYLAALGEALRASGIMVDQTRSDSTARVDSLFAVMSAPLREVMPLFEKPSQNQIGELLFKTLALTKTGVGTADSAAQVVTRQLLAWGAAPDGFVVHDGSGLSRHDYVAPRTLVRVLDVMRQSPDFKLFYDALPIAGVDGTIRNRMKGTPAAGNLHAKTGTIDKARSLSGYVTTADGRLLLFSALCNNYSAPTRRVDQVTDALGIRLATLRLDR